MKPDPLPPCALCGPLLAGVPGREPLAAGPGQRIPAALTANSRTAMDRQPFAATRTLPRPRARRRGSQPMAGLTRAMLHGYAAVGGRYRETVIDDSSVHHGSFGHVPIHTAIPPCGKGSNIRPISTGGGGDRLVALAAHKDVICTGARAWLARLAGAWSCPALTDRAEARRAAGPAAPPGAGTRSRPGPWMPSPPVRRRASAGGTDTPAWC